jgi:hypothetical protein
LTIEPSTFGVPIQQFLDPEGYKGFLF